MSGYQVLADVGESLINAVWEEIQADPDLLTLIGDRGQITLGPPTQEPAPDEPTPRLSIYLYRILEDPHMKNRPPVPGTGGKLRRPPLTLDLFYLVTPLLERPAEQQIVLGKVMQIFYDRPALEATDLSGELGVAQETVRIVFNPVTLEETARVWQALETSYRLSVCYMARVAMLDSTQERFLRPVIERSNAFQEKPKPAELPV